MTCTHTHTRAEIQRHTDTHHCLQGEHIKEPPLLLGSVFTWIPKVCVNPVWGLAKWEGTKAVGSKGPDVLELDTSISACSPTLTAEVLAPGSTRGLDGVPGV